ncbi:uncharacterized protein LOC127104207 [Lathyrus oleraceus]|uniref:uncharacterized protein LOC127104207 n=1 Tax=Pisum sativum TaxID=3888 RepID=UPI0021CF9E9E|nr:uncharacterized protein LOC127104207 [Pisum sativum]
MGARLEQQPIRREVPEEQPRRVIMVNRDQDADEVIHRVRRENMMENDLTKLPRGCKIPKFTKFSGDTSESTIEHIARYMTEAGDLANSENLRMKYFPSSLTKNTFTWFTTLPPNFIDAWPQLERLFHEQFYMGQTKISLKELASIKRKFTEPIDDYLNRFRLLKSRCFTIVPEHELVEMAAGDEESKIAEDPYGLEEFEVDLAELKEAPPYACKLLTPSNGRNTVETEKNDRFPKKTYTFDLTKCDEIFDLLVKDGQMIVPPNTKIPPDLIQNAIRDGRLKFADKGKNQMKIDIDPLNVAETNYAEPVEINMVDVREVEAIETAGT